ncbi:hypothetical protein D9619_003745 [Psilocybe cf. subviscida]|uniref:CBF1-interacting co-repressor CIR N-terminal domain-containing protein n=1 Tax=Psilocybe cf. subviscida TaxID=2480587 RepID=A0A8H5AXW1_9AGAR|nr:hypothetical protein D9619_003745 [Psilocybe cf. subviscida]
MGKLNIAHHKSYHPYRRDNIDRVRRDEEEAKLKEEKEEGRMLLADSEARIDLLRERAGISEKAEEKKKRRDYDDTKHIASSSSMTGAILPTTNGHINLFEDLEMSALAAVAKVSKKTTANDEKGVALAPSAKDLNPWYSSASKDKPEDVEDDKRKREEYRKNAHDPLTSIERQLASRSSGFSSSSSSRGRMAPPVSTRALSDKPPEVQARLTRESSERERALELIRRKKRETLASMTPTTVNGDDAESGYGDVFNKREVEEAHRYKDRRWDGGWRREDRDRNRNWDRRSPPRHRR